MKLIASRDVDFPSLGRFVREGEFEATEEEAEDFLTSPYITIKEQKNGTYPKVGRVGNRS